MKAGSLACCVVFMTLFVQSLGEVPANVVVQENIIVPEVEQVYAGKWRMDLRQAVEGATTQLSNNLISALNGLANSGLKHGANITHAVGTLTKGLVTNTIDLAGVVGYMPKLLLQDMPTQLVEVLKLIRRNEIRVPSDVNTSIDNVLAFVQQTRESGISERVFGPITRFVPNLLSGANDFLVTIFDNLFSLLAGDAGTRQTLLRA